MFTTLRQQLLDQRAAIAERLEAVDQAEAALARVRRVFGLENAAQDAPGEALAVPGSALPADPAERVLVATGRQQRCAAPGCTVTFPPHGNKQFHSPACRYRVAQRRRAQRKDAEWREQTDQLRQLHAAEGFDASNGAVMEG